jgi:hypothetical protein
LRRPERGSPFQEAERSEWFLRRLFGSDAGVNLERHEGAATIPQEMAAGEPEGRTGRAAQGAQEGARALLVGVLRS